MLSHIEGIDLIFTKSDLHSFEDDFFASLGDSDIEEILSEASNAHLKSKETRRYNRRKNRTSSRNRRGALRTMHDEHLIKLYNVLYRAQRLKADDDRAMKLALMELDSDDNKVLDESPIELDSDISKTLKKSPKIFEPFSLDNLSKVLHTFDRVIHALEELRNGILMGDVIISSDEDATDLYDLTNCLEIIAIKYERNPLEYQILRSMVFALYGY